MMLQPLRTALVLIRFDGVHADYDVGRDGTIFAFQSPSGSTLVVVKNLATELRERVRGEPK